MTSHTYPYQILYIIHEGYNKTQPKKNPKREWKFREMKKDLPSERKTDSRSLILTLLGRSSDCSPKSAALLLSPTIDYQNKQQNINWKYHNCNQKAPEGDKVSTFDSDLGSETNRPESISSPITFFEKISNQSLRLSDLELGQKDYNFEVHKTRKDRGGLRIHVGVAVGVVLSRWSLKFWCLV